MRRETLEGVCRETGQSLREGKVLHAGLSSGLLNGRPGQKLCLLRPYPSN